MNQKWQIKTIFLTNTEHRWKSTIEAKNDNKTSGSLQSIYLQQDEQLDQTRKINSHLDQ